MFAEQKTKLNKTKKDEKPQQPQARKNRSFQDGSFQDEYEKGRPLKYEA